MAKIAWPEKFGYGLGDAASNLFWMTFVYFQVNYYTDVYGLAAGAVATLLLVTRIWAMFTDVIVGVTADRTTTRRGKFRPYLLWLALPFGIMSVLTFTVPAIGPAGKLVYAYGSLALMMLVYSGINIPYAALVGVISPDPQERTSLTSWRFSFAYIGGIIVAVCTQPMVTFLGQHDSALGYQRTIAVYGAAAAILFLVCYASTEERVQPVRAVDAPTWRHLKDLATNGPWLILCLIGIVGVCLVSIRGAAIIYYFKYYMADRVIAPFGVPLHLGGTAGVSLFILLNTVLALVGTFLVQYVTPYTGRKKTYVLCTSIAAIILVASYWVQPRQLELLYCYHAIYSILTGSTAALLWAMIADTADYSEWKTGRRATGLVFSAAGMSNKFGWAIGGGLSATLLAIYSYQANVVQSESAIGGIRILMALAPAVAAILCSILMMFYGLERKMPAILADLAVRRSQDANV